MNYSGNVAAQYEADRIREPLWEKEQQCVRVLLDDWAAVTSVLDIPVGTGRFIPLYVDRCLSVVGIDASEDMIREARQKCPDVPGIALQIGDASRLDLPSKSVDYSVCWRLAHLVPHETLSAILAELCRVTRKEFAIQFYGLRYGRRSRLSWIGDALRTARAYVAAIIRPSPWAHIRNYTHFGGDVEDCLAANGAKVVKAVRIPDRQYDVLVYVVSCAP